MTSQRKKLKAAYFRKLAPKVESKPIQVKFWDVYDEFVESSIGRVVNDVIKDYKSLKKHLKAFEKHTGKKITFKIFNYSWYDRFKDFLTYETEKPNGEKGLATNTVGKQIKNLKVFLNYCFRHEIVERFDLSNFTTISEDTDAIYLTEKEITKIYEFDLSETPELEESRDLLVLGCQIELRSKDLFRLRPEMLNDGRIHIKMHKSHKNVVVPLQRYTKEIIEKYNNDFPNKQGATKFNVEIKEIGRLAGIDSDVILTYKKGTAKTDKVFKKYQLISSHTCRRSFCTNQYIKGVQTVYLMKISGHSTEKAFLRYIKVDEEMAADKMEEIWENDDLKNPIRSF